MRNGSEAAKDLYSYQKRRQEKRDKTILFWILHGQMELCSLGNLALTDVKPGHGFLSRSLYIRIPIFTGVVNLLLKLNCGYGAS